MNTLLVPTNQTSSIKLAAVNNLAVCKVTALPKPMTEDNTTLLADPATHKPFITTLPLRIGAQGPRYRKLNESEKDHGANCYRDPSTGCSAVLKLQLAGVISRGSRSRASFVMTNHDGRLTIRRCRALLTTVNMPTTGFARVHILRFLFEPDEDHSPPSKGMSNRFGRGDSCDRRQNLPQGHLHPSSRKSPLNCDPPERRSSTVPHETNSPSAGK